MFKILDDMFDLDEEKKQNPRGKAVNIVKSRKQRSPLQKFQKRKPRQIMTFTKMHLKPQVNYKKKAKKMRPKPSTALGGQIKGQVSLYRRL